ncbi:MAG: DUF815 domain-containing protein [Aquificaceae bacterium]|nr:DUF815 domain-containing protein [Aquificaceae bacterium]
MVESLALRRGLNIDKKELENLALQWAINNGFSGRSAFQFIKDLEGMLKLKG